jgi:hypothetical protein
MDRPTCKTCPYYHEERTGSGSCRKLSPGARTGPAFTEADRWCGEHPRFGAYLASQPPPGVAASPRPRCRLCGGAGFVVRWSPINNEYAYDHPCPNCRAARED